MMSSTKAPKSWTVDERGKIFGRVAVLSMKFHGKVE